MIADNQYNHGKLGRVKVDSLDRLMEGDGNVYRPFAVKAPNI